MSLIIDRIVSIEEVSGTDAYEVVSSDGKHYFTSDADVVQDWVALGNTVTVRPLPPEPTVEQAIESLPPLWKAALEAYIEQQPRSRKAIIRNIKRHLK